ncbi:MAG: class I SAM-dependent methyltransferase [Bacteroidetes bacterium]|nr:class I SAM-dependent methyltransferase [Bacteroidota bacterium]
MNNATQQQEALLFYTELYNGFQSLPGYSAEKTVIERVISVLESGGRFNLSSFNSLVDLGCGIGFKTNILFSRIKKAIGIDFIQKAVETGNVLTPGPDLSFICDDVLCPVHPVKGDLVSAFGLSVLNTSDPDLFVSRIILISENYLLAGGTIWILNPTNFSGTAPGGWYNHTKQELKNLKTLLQKTGKFEVTLDFIHHSPAFFVKDGFYWFLHRFFRLITGKPQFYSLLIKQK